ncbi:MAG TPA: hypothetical protein VJN90_06560 [Candidatus Acidoferrales bacterium]|nr:hypothetical protein [Candidatus Acidoferrales bacterium]
MNRVRRARQAAALAILFAGILFALSSGRGALRVGVSGSQVKKLAGPATGSLQIHRAIAFDVSPPLALLQSSTTATARPSCGSPSCGTSPGEQDATQKRNEPPPLPAITAAGAAVEQTSQGERPAAPLLESFDGLGVGFEGPQSTPASRATYRNPSDNSLAAGPDNIVQIVNSRLAVFTKKGARYGKSGTALYGPVPTNIIFSGFGGVCDARDNGDAVVRYDQLADRWLIVMPIFSRIAPGEFQSRGEAQAQGKSALRGQAARPGQPSDPGPPAAPPANPNEAQGTYAMCYAVSTSSDPLGTYYRYAFERSLFPDYPRPAIWPDGYYVPTSTGDTVIQKHVCIADRNRMLKGEPATEQCIIIDGVNFLNNADVDGKDLPPPGAPNIMMAAGGTQLKNIFDDDGIYFWKVHVDWRNPANTNASGPVKIGVAPYHYLCNGQLSNCVPQPGTEQRLDAQGDKIMQRLVYRRIGDHESIVAAHSIATKSGGGGVRWYEFRLDEKRNPVLYQEGTYAPDDSYRWMPSIAMDRNGDIGVGYSFGGASNFAGQRFAGRLAGDAKNLLTLHETVLVNGEAAQTNTLRWEDYTTIAIDPSDDCTFWYVGDYLKAGEAGYSTKIGSFRLPGCAEPASR